MRPFGEGSAHALLHGGVGRMQLRGPAQLRHCIEATLLANPATILSRDSVASHIQAGKLSSWLVVRPKVP